MEIWEIIKGLELMKILGIISATLGLSLFIIWGIFDEKKEWLILVILAFIFIAIGAGLAGYAKGALTYID